MFLIRWALAVLIVLLVLPWSFELLRHTWRTFSLQHVPHPWYIVGGFAVGLAWVIWRRPNWLVHTVIHEACHALACLLLLVRIRNFQASDGHGGMVMHDRVDPVRGTIISLAPYTLPLILLPLLIWRSLDPQLPWLSAAVAFAWVHHLHGLYHNIRLNFWGRQADLSKAGKPLSVATISAIFILVTAWTLHILSRW